MILAPVVVNRKGEQLDLLRRAARAGLRARARRRHGARDRRACRKLAKNVEAHDRGRRRPAAASAPTCKQRLAESFETALRHGDGRALAVEMDNANGRRGAPLLGQVRLPDLQLLAAPSSSRGCSRSTIPMGACPRCDGLGAVSFFDPSASSRFPQLSLALGRDHAAGTGATSSTSRCCRASRSTYGFDLEQPFDEAAGTRPQTLILYGSGDEKIPFIYLTERGKPTVTRARVRRHHAATSSGATARPTRRTVREELAKYLNTQRLPGVRRDAAAARGAPRQGRRAAATRRSTRSPRCRSGETPPVLRDARRSTAQKAAIAERIVREIVEPARSS